MATKQALKLAKNSSSLSRFVFSRNINRCSLFNVANEFTGSQHNVRSFTISSLLEQPRDCSPFLKQKYFNKSFEFISIRSSSISFKRNYNAASDLPPFQEIGMPSLSPTMTQGNIAKWRKSVGDSIAAGDVLCEIETDKATLEMESMEDGFIARILYEEGAKDLSVGTPIAILVESEDDIAKFANYSSSSSSPPPPPSPAKEDPPSPSPPPSPPSKSVQTKVESFTPPSSITDADFSSRVFASPAAKKLAEDKKVDISQLKGTGPDGRIVKADVEELLKMAAPPSPPTPTLTPIYASQTASYIDIPTTQIRRVIASRLLQSKQTIPHYYLSIDVKVDKLNSVRTEFNTIQEKNGGSKISLNDFVIKAAALACKKVPECNSEWANDHIRQYNNVDVNVAVQTDVGLMVPFVKNADIQGLSSISSEVKRLAQAARENKLKPDEFQGGTFSVSNLGMFGIKSFCAVINPPQSAILAVGGSEERVVPGKVKGEFQTASFMNVTLSCDHRVVDGAVGAKWLNAFKSYLEDPIIMLL